MAINPKTNGLHHIALRCKDMTATKKFYRDVIGIPLVLDSADIIAFTIGALFLVFKKANTEFHEKPFSPFLIGLDHIAIACETEEELQRVAKALADAGVENTGVKLDETLQKNYVAFKDPDRIQWEFYMQ